jgi:putative Mn2+ efflux pump MntP
MKQKFGSVIVTVIGALMMMDGMKQNTTWAEVPSLFTPLVVLGLALVIWRAWAGTGQMKMPDFKKLGNK